VPTFDRIPFAPAPFRSVGENVQNRLSNPIRGAPLKRALSSGVDTLGPMGDAMGAIPTATPRPRSSQIHRPARFRPCRRLQALAIVNPVATRMSNRLCRATLAPLASTLDLETVPTEAPGHAIELAEKARAQGLDLVIAFGGDGVANEVLNGLIAAPSEDPTPVMACLPAGRTNVLARLLGFPLDPARAAGQLADPDRRQLRRLQLSTVNRRYFACSAGIGLDAAVVRAAHHRLRKGRRIGPVFYPLTAGAIFWHSFARSNAPAIRVRTETRRYRAVTVCVQNGRHYTYLGNRSIDLVSRGDLRSEALSGALLGRTGKRSLVRVAWQLARGGAAVADHSAFTGLVDIHELQVSVEGGAKLALHADGEYLGDVDRAEFRAGAAQLDVLT